MKSHKVWVMSVLSIVVCMLLLIAAFNFAIDPYGVYHFSEQSYNFQKIQSRDPYQFKAYHSRRAQPQAVVLGTSRAMRLSPEHLQSLTGKTTYNLGLAAANPYVILEYLKYMIRVDKRLETVYLGLDFETFNQHYPVHANFSEQRLRSPLYIQDLFATLLSAKALQDSRKVLSDNLHHTLTYTDTRFYPDGSFSETYVYPESTNLDTFKQLPNTYALSEQSVSYLKEAKELCRHHGIGLIAFVSPVHAIVLESFWQNGLWPEYQAWERQLAEIMPFWDFSGYHAISMSSLQSKENYNDLSHFSRAVGDLIGDKLIGRNVDAVPVYFGVEVTKQNIDRHLEELTLSREQWSAKGQDLLKLLSSY